MKELWEREYEAAVAAEHAAEAPKPRPEEAEARALREQVWAVKHEAEWREWERVRLLLDWTIDFAAGSPPFDFDDFLREVGRCPSPDRRVVRRDKALPYQPGNLRWSRPRRKPTEPAGLDAKQAAAFLGIALQTLYNNRPHIPSMPGFKKLMFDRKVLEDLRQSPRFRALRSRQRR